MGQHWEVIVMKGESEPWWFFPDWKKDIIETYSFTNKEMAIQKYSSIFLQLQSELDHCIVKKTSLAAFWNQGDISYCEHCDDDLQMYYGLMILLNGEPYTFLESDDVIKEIAMVSMKREIT